MRGHFALESRSVSAKRYETDNVVTTKGRDSIISAIAQNISPGWSYIAVGVGTSTPGSAQTALDREIFRTPVVGGYVPNPGTARLLAVLDTGEGCGDLREIGVFNADARRVVLSSCDGTANWQSDGTLTAETTIVMEGAASLRAQMGTAGEVAFHGSLSPALGSVTFGTPDYLQFWYRTEQDVGTVTVEVGDPTVYYRFMWAPGTTDAWVLFHNQLGSATKVGSGSPSSWSYFKLYHSAIGTVFYEYLDWVSLFGKSGDLLARGTIDASKDHGEAYNLYYSFKLE